MATPAQITDGQGAGNKAHVTVNGQLAVAPIEYDSVATVELAEPNIGYNFFKPKAHMQFVITGIRMRADRDVAQTADATVELYESDSATSTTVTRAIWTENMVRGESVALFPVNILLSEGVWLNGKTTDDDIFATIIGYYVGTLPARHQPV